MKKIQLFVTVALAAASALPSMLSAQAAPCTSGFGSVPAATFGGSGIPNSAVAYTNCPQGFSLNLTAHQRYDNPAPTNNGAGVFTALPGQDANTVSPNPAYAKWNFGYDVQGTNRGAYSYRLYFDNNPASGNALDGYLAVPGIFGLGYANSLNLGMGVLNLGILGPAPSYQPFDYNAIGEYQFDLVAYDNGLNEVARTSMLVTTGTVVPEPSTYALMVAGLALVGVAARRRKTIA